MTMVKTKAGLVIRLSLTRRKTKWVYTVESNEEPAVDKKTGERMYRETERVCLGFAEMFHTCHLTRYGVGGVNEKE